MKKLTLKFSLIAHIQYFIIFIKNIKMRNSLLKYMPFIFLFIFSACEIENQMTDDELIEAIINSNEKVKILETDLPLDAKNTLINDKPDDFFCQPAGFAELRAAGKSPEALTQASSRFKIIQHG